jgi:hypothetical protein
MVSRELRLSSIVIATATFSAEFWTHEIESARLSADRDSRSIAIVVNSGTAVERGDLLLDRNAGATAELG